MILNKEQSETNENPLQLSGWKFYWHTIIFCFSRFKNTDPRYFASRFALVKGYIYSRLYPRSAFSIVVSLIWLELSRGNCGFISTGIDLSIAHVCIFHFRYRAQNYMMRNPRPSTCCWQDLCVSAAVGFPLRGRWWGIIWGTAWRKRRHSQGNWSHMTSKLTHVGIQPIYTLGFIMRSRWSTARRVTR